MGPVLIPGLAIPVDPLGETMSPEPVMDSGAGVSVDPMEVETSPEDREQERRLVQTWWERTEERADFKAVAEQTKKDLEALQGGTDQEIQDEAHVTTFDIYRNAIQTVALTVPGIPTMRFEGKEVMDPLPGDVGIGDPIREAVAMERRKRNGLAKVLTLLVQEYAKRGKMQRKLEAAVQDAGHFQILVAKTWFQREFTSDPANEGRGSDQQEQVEYARVLIEERDRGLWDDRDPKADELAAILRAVGRSELDVRRQVMLEIVPPMQYRCDPAVMDPVNKDRAGWERQDVLKRRNEVLAQFPRIKPDDLQEGMWSLDDTGMAVKREREERTSISGTAMTSAAVRQLNVGVAQGASDAEEDWFLVAEIYDYVTNRRLTLVDGVPYIAHEVPLIDEGEGLSPFHILVFNRRPNALAGWSDTQMQAKLVRHKQRVRSQEEDAKDLSQPRWGYDPAKVGEKTVLKIAAAPPGSAVPIDVIGGGALKDAMFPLVASNSYRAQDYDTTKIDQDLRRAAMLPEQALGVTGNADFAAEVNVAAAAATSMAKYRGRLVTDFIGSILTSWGKLLLWNLPIQEVVRVCGPAAALYWPQTPEDRKALFAGLAVKVDTNLDQDLDAARKTQALGTLTTSLASVPPWINKQAFAKILAKHLGMADEAQDLVEPDAAGLIEQLMLALQENPAALPPEGMQILAQMGMQAAEMLAQAQAEEMAAANGGAPPPGVV